VKAEISPMSSKLVTSCRYIMSPGHKVFTQELIIFYVKLPQNFFIHLNHKCPFYKQGVAVEIRGMTLLCNLSRVTLSQ
jgi:hypothetical protein